MSTRASWIAWLLVTGVLGSYCLFSLAFDNQSVYLPGRTTDGHYQLELSCQQCHTPFGGVAQDACLKCHQDKGDGVGEANKTNSHVASKFDDPRNAERIEALDARKCMTCHVEHWPQGTHRGGFTVAEDFCVKCHEDVGTERPSHAGMSFFSCSDAGCHNYHDNRALFEDFLANHLGEPPILAKPSVLQKGQKAGKRAPKALKAQEQDAPASVQAAQAVAEWEESAHARAGVNCSACHGAADAWIAKPTRAACTGCHETQDQGFLGGKHGMRQAAGLAPMQPSMARLPMRAEANEVALDCNTCHGAHRYDTRKAAVDSCLACHADEHSVSYRRSPHFKLWEREIAGAAAAGTGVSCATCHLPREKNDGSATVVVQHNQNDNLRPNEKMVRNVCAACHGMSFSLDSIADDDLVRHNFDGRPAKHVASVDMVEKRAKSRKEGR